MAGVRSTTKLHQAMRPLMDSTLHTVAMLVLHLTKHTILEPRRLAHHLEVLRLFEEAIDDAVQETIDDQAIPE